MASHSVTTTGHSLSDASWLDAHFQSARIEYEDALRYVGIQPGWKVLDAGCGAGGFLPLMAELVDRGGAVVALDLAPENVAHVENSIRGGRISGNVTAQVGSLLRLPFEDSTFDCLWSANVMQYLTETEFVRAMIEFMRVLKPCGTLALKDFDDTLFQMRPFDPSVLARNFSERRRKYDEAGIVGPSCGVSLASRLRKAGFIDIRRKTWFVERWAPVEQPTRTFATSLVKVWSDQAETHNIPPADLEIWRQFASDPGRVLDDPDFCLREAFVVAVGKVAK